MTAHMAFEPGAGAAVDGPALPDVPLSRAQYPVEQALDGSVFAAWREQARAGEQEAAEDFAGRVLAALRIADTYVEDDEARQAMARVLRGEPEELVVQR